jgi:hypothetical protein
MSHECNRVSSQREIPAGFRKYARENSSWGTGTTTSTTSGNSTRLCPRTRDGWRERDFETHVQAPLMHVLIEI